MTIYTPLKVLNSEFYDNKNNVLLENAPQWMKKEYNDYIIALQELDEYDNITDDELNKFIKMISE